jgi:hypothetical protein
MDDLHKSIMERALLAQVAPVLQILGGGTIRPSTYALPAAIEFELPWADENDPLGMPAVVRFIPIILYHPDKIRIIWRLERDVPELDFCDKRAFHFDLFRHEDLATADLRIFCALAGARAPKPNTLCCAQTVRCSNASPCVRMLVNRLEGIRKRRKNEAIT